ncbi:MAG: hypothetical protein WBA74_26205, partial [Cyclobacteriaceae bacterium]
MKNLADYTIQRTEKDRNAVNYRFLLDEGMKHVAKYSGGVWTNYNHSDPGITILQNLCYALTELGYKTNLPIADLLTEKDGKIDYEEHFYLPEKVLTINPIVLDDFRKMLMNSFSVIKQVYFLSPKLGSATWFLQPIIEVNQVSEHKIKRTELQDKVDLLLNQHANLGRVFAPSECLLPKEILLSGEVHITDDANTEEVIAKAIFAINNLYSAFPVYQSYTTLIEAGKDPSVLLEGPFLANGYISDNCLSDKRDQLRIEEISDVLLNMNGVEFVGHAGFLDSHSNDVIDMLVNEAPVSSVIQFHQADTRLKWFKGGKQIAAIDFGKVTQYFYQQFTYQKKQDLSSLLPTGTYKAVGEYYSFQNQFPSAYQLTNIHSKDVSQNAQVLQFKGYLMFYDQLMAGFLAQLENLPSLFSFRSGRNSENVSSRTYYDQPIYSVPGARYLLKGAETYVTSGAVRNKKDHNWRLYKEDHSNPYMRTLNKGKISEEDNLRRKTTILNHLLARVGQQYPGNALYYTNPLYGKRQSDMTDHMSRMLLNFEELSANKSRSYYKSASDDKFVSGFERIL